MAVYGAAAGQAVQLVGRFPNTPGEVSRWCGCCEPSTAPHCARVTRCRLSAVRVACWGCRSCFSMPLKPRSRCGRRSSSLQVQRCENARTPSAVPTSLLQQVELYKGPKSQDLRRPGWRPCCTQQSSTEKRPPKEQPRQISPRNWGSLAAEAFLSRRIDGANSPGRSKTHLLGSWSTNTCFVY